MWSRAMYVAIAIGMGAWGVACGPTYPNCDNDEQCHEGEYCINGRCEACRDDSQCPVGQMCEQNDCVPIPGWCNGNADCPPDHECRNNACVYVEPVIAQSEPQAVPQQCQLEAVYFAFDESNLDDAARTALQNDVNCMRERSISAVQVTGMADPRGTEEYNLALGTRRANATRDHLVRLGVERRSVSTHSVGEERATGSDEYSWSRDRRAEVTER